MKSEYLDRAAELVVMIVLGIVVAVMLVGMVLGANNAMSQNELSECYTWGQQSVDYKNLYYLKQWQKDQCDSYGIMIDAPIR